VDRNQWRSPGVFTGLGVATIAAFTPTLLSFREQNIVIAAYFFFQLRANNPLYKFYFCLALFCFLMYMLRDVTRGIVNILLRLGCNLKPEICFSLAHELGNLFSFLFPQFEHAGELCMKAGYWCFERCNLGRRNKGDVDVTWIA
jgi:hypothetical protein